MSTERIDVQLVRECLSGSERAWTDFYCRYESLVKSIVKRRLRFSAQEIEDVTQTVFTVLLTALKTYDPSYSLGYFVSMIADRVSIGEYRSSKRAKREGWTVPLDCDSSGEEGAGVGLCSSRHQEQELETAQIVHMVRRAFRGLSEKCRELLRLRYSEELPYKEIMEILGGTENTLTVRARRCLEELRATWDELQRRGVRT